MINYNSCFKEVDRNCSPFEHHGGLAQLGERLPYKQRVTGSSPVSSIEPLAQLVEHLTFNQRVDSSRLSRLINQYHHAGVAELADALDLGSSVLRRGGSSPFTRISLKTK